MKKLFLNFFTFSLFAGLLLCNISCDDNNDVKGDDDDDDDNTTDTRTYFNLVVGINVEESSGATYVAAYKDLSSTSQTISFKGWGYEVPSVRTARVYGSEDGTNIYNLSYGGGTIAKYAVNGGDSYSQVKELDISLAMETEYPRWTKVSEEYASLHNVVVDANPTLGENESYLYHGSTCILTAINLENFSIVTDYNAGGGAKFAFPRSSEDDELKLHVWRIDAPAIHNGKAYYGLNKRSWDPATGKNISTSDYSAASLVVDFPSLKNPKIITSTVAKGSTQGYRTPVAHADEKGDIYQITSSDSHLLKISNGDYDNSYVFDLAKALGMQKVAANGWFYVGDGIGYVPFYDNSEGKGSSSAIAAWGVARVDLYSKTAIKLNLPANLWLQQYQYGVVGDDGLFYMAIAPLGGNGNIYMLDPKSASADGFTVGAKIETLDSSSAYIGIF